MASSESSSSSLAGDAKKRRQDMIQAELEPILEAARDFCFEHYEEDMEEEAIGAIRKAVDALAYRKTYFDVMKDKVVYLPSCRRLILTRDLIDEAEKHYYEEEDEFPAEYSKAIRCIVFEKEQKKEDNAQHEIDEEEFMEKLAMEWTDTLHIKP